MSPSRAALLSNQVKGLMCWLVAYTMKIRSLSFGTRSKTQCTKSTGQGWKVLFLRKTLELQVFKKVNLWMLLSLHVVKCTGNSHQWTNQKTISFLFVVLWCRTVLSGTQKGQDELWGRRARSESVALRSKRLSEAKVRNPMRTERETGTDGATKKMEVVCKKNVAVWDCFFFLHAYKLYWR